MEERRMVAATRQVSRGRTLIEKKGDMRERKKGLGRKKQGLVGRLRGMVGDSSLATCRGFFSLGVRTRLPSDIFLEFFAERFPVSITSHKVLLNFYPFFLSLPSSASSADRKNVIDILALARGIHQTWRICIFISPIFHRFLMNHKIDSQSSSRIINNFLNGL